MTRNLMNLLARFRRDRRAGVLIVSAVWVTAFAGVAGTVADLGHVMYVKKVLRTETEAAALAGAMNLNVGSGGTAISTATSYSSASGNLNADSGVNATLVSGYPKLVCLAAMGSCSSSWPDGAYNSIVVKQQASVPLYFGKLLGLSSKTITATAMASQSGGGKPKLDIVLVLDTTASMNSTDSSCSNGSSHASYTRLQCAESGVQTLLTGLYPGSTGSPTTQVALMAFPPLSSPTQAQYDYACSGSTNPTTAHYNALTSATNSYATSGTTPTYLVLPFRNDYKASDQATALNTSSNLVRSMGGGGTSCPRAIAAIGGSGTFYADAIMAAQSYLTANGRSTATKVIVLLSDGDANSSYGPSNDVFSPSIPLSETTKQCHNAITAANYATGKGTKVYTIAYGAPLSGCSGDTPSISPCETLKKMASDYNSTTDTASMFYSNTAGASSSTACNAVTGNTTSSGLNTLFSLIQSGLNSQEGSSPRLWPDGTI